MPFISTTFIKSYRLTGYYKEIYISRLQWPLAATLRDIEKKYFYSKKLGNSQYEFDDTLEDKFDVSSFIKDITIALNKFNADLSLLREFKLNMILDSTSLYS